MAFHKGYPWFTKLHLRNNLMQRKKKKEIQEIATVSLNKLGLE